MISSGLYNELPPIMQTFALMPLMHAEDLENQDLCLTKFKQLEAAHGISFVAFAEKHRDVVAQFGRFPSRNAYLGRESTPAEEEYIAGGGGF